MLARSQDPRPAFQAAGRRPLLAIPSARAHWRRRSRSQGSIRDGIATIEGTVRKTVGYPSMWNSILFSELVNGTDREVRCIARSRFSEFRVALTGASVRAIGDAANDDSRHTESHAY